jgi:serine/threonine-protein kinase HipA
MTTAELEVWIGEERAGLLRRVGRGELELTYDDTWIDQSAATPLSVSLPVAEQTIRGHRLVSWLWGLLPDNERVIVRWAATAQCAPTDLFALLRLVGHDVAGAVRFLPAGTTSKSRAGFVALSSDEVGEYIAELRRDSATWHRASSGRWSLAGAQPKVALAFDDVRSTWGVPSGSRPTTHIVKPGIAGLQDHHVNEQLCLSAAALVGLRAATSSIMQFGKERALVVTRYDRLHRARKILRVHQEDCCQALGIHPSLKYQVDGGPGAEDLVALIRSVVLTNSTQDVDQYLRSLGFNWLTLGTDGHAKNWSLLLSGAQVRLAPLYDIASALPCDEHPKKLRLAQKIGGEYSPTKIARRHWERVATTSRVDADELLHHLATMAEMMADAFADARTTAGLNPGEMRTSARLIDSVATWSKSCRNRL